MKVSAVIVTRGDVALAEIVESLRGLDEVLVYDNSVRENLAVYGRYVGVREARNEVVLVQDDDVVLPPDSLDALLAAYTPDALTANLPAHFRPHYSDSCLVGFGACFPRDLPERAFQKWTGNYGSVLAAPPRVGEPIGAFLRTADVVFTTLTPRVLVDVPYRDLPWATGPDRMYRQPTHVGERQRMLELARAVRDA